MGLLRKGIPSTESLQSRNCSLLCSPNTRMHRGLFTIQDIISQSEQDFRITFFQGIQCADAVLCAQSLHTVSTEGKQTFFTLYSGIHYKQCCTFQITTAIVVSVPYPAKGWQQLIRNRLQPMKLAPRPFLVSGAKNLKTSSLKRIFVSNALY
jgi:hypothetical protein